MIEHQSGLLRHVDHCCSLWAQRLGHSQLVNACGSQASGLMALFTEEPPASKRRQRLLLISRCERIGRCGEPRLCQMRIMDVVRERGGGAPSHPDDGARSCGTGNNCPRKAARPFHELTVDRHDLAPRLRESDCKRAHSWPPSRIDPGASGRVSSLLSFYRIRSMQETSPVGFQQSATLARNRNRHVRTAWLASGWPVVKATAEGLVACPSVEVVGG